MFPIPVQHLVLFSGVVLFGTIPGQVPRTCQAEVPEAPAPHVKRLSVAEIHRLIAQLGSDEYPEREAANAKLKRRPEAAVHLLRAIRTTDNPEIKLRLPSIFREMMSREGAQRRLARLPEYVKHRQFDRLVETMVACREFVTAEHDKHVRAFVKDVLTAAINGKEKEVPWTSDLYEFGTGRDIDSILIGRTTRAPRGPGSDAIAADQIKDHTPMVASVALCNGDVDVTLIGRSVVIATGTVRLFAGADASVIISLGDVFVDSGGGVVIVTAGKRVYDSSSLDMSQNIIRENDREFFRSWKFYSSREAGVILGSLFGVTWAQEVVPESPFARAGIKPGDLLTAVDTIPIRSVREANRLLCRATVSWGATDLSIVRGTKQQDVIVTLCEW